LTHQGLYTNLSDTQFRVTPDEEPVT